jgi:hypothetical protein
MQTSHRLGTFFILVGLALLLLFVGSFLSKNTNINFLGAALVTLVLGFLLHKNREPTDSGRFKTLRKASERSNQRREEKKNKNQKEHFKNLND